MDIKFNMIRATLSAKGHPGDEKFRTAFAQMRAEQANADAADARGARHDLVSRVVPVVRGVCAGGGVGGGGGGG